MGLASILTGRESLDESLTPSWRRSCEGVVGPAPGDPIAGISDRLYWICWDMKEPAMPISSDSTLGLFSRLPFRWAARAGPGSIRPAR